jgi:hypothetical protein
MRKMLPGVFVAALLVVAGSPAWADAPSLNCEYLEPCPSDLYDLDHWKYYTWGIQTPWDTATEEAVFVKLTLTDIRNWQWNEPNDLYIHLLDNAPLGVKVYNDTDGGSDNFAGQGVLVLHLHNLSAYPQTITYDFTPQQVAALNAYAADGVFALGFDPDCHYYNNGVSLKICTQPKPPVPEPTVMSMLGLGALPMLARFRRRRKA